MTDIDDELPGMGTHAWRHHCGHLNEGSLEDAYLPLVACMGCRTSLKRASEIEAHYELREISGVTVREGS